MMPHDTPCLRHRRRSRTIFVIRVKDTQSSPYELPATLTRARTTNGRGWKSKPTMCDTGNLARASHFVYEAIKSRQLGLRRFDFRSPDGSVAFVGFIIDVLYLGAA